MWPCARYKFHLYCIVGLGYCNFTTKPDASLQQCMCKPQETTLIKQTGTNRGLHERFITDDLPRSMPAGERSPQHAIVLSITSRCWQRIITLNRRRSFKQPIETFLWAEVSLAYYNRPTFNRLCQPERQEATARYPNEVNDSFLRCES